VWLSFFMAVKCPHGIVAASWWRLWSAGGELLHDDHVLVWGSAACCLALVWIIFVVLTISTMWLDQLFYICWLKLTCNSFSLKNVSLEFFHVSASFCLLIFFISVGFHRQLDVWTNYGFALWCAVNNVQVRDSLSYLLMNLRKW
jgi:hypothetical protein